MCHVALKDTLNTSKQDFGAPVVGQVADEDVLRTMAGAWGGPAAARTRGFLPAPSCPCIQAVCPPGLLTVTTACLENKLFGKALAPDEEINSSPT